MPTRTARPTPPGRFGRQTPPAGRATARTTLSAGRLPRSPRRKPAPRSKSNRALSALAGKLPASVLGRAAKPSAAAGGVKGHAGKLALLAGAAGLALKNRDRLPGPLGRRETAEPIAPEPVATNTGDPIATTVPAPVAVPVEPAAAGQRAAEA